MRFRVRILAAAVAVTGFAMTTPPTTGDEGMWLFNNVPKKLLKEKYNFEPTDAWLEHLQKSSVRFNSGGSGSFVSANGLVMTNHHVGADDLQKLSTKEKDYLKDGFQAKTPAEEIKCKALELNCLQAIKDVTADVNAAVKEGIPPAEAFKARQAKIAEIEKANTTDKSVRADVVTLFAGGAYHLYTYKKYTDIRLVFAPEKGVAFFGGDPDNFEFPRFDLDMCFFRVYENGQPIKCEHHLKWSEAGSKEGELTFVSGHPGRTNRQNTIAELEYLRDTGYPYLMQRLNRLEVLLGSWVARSEANRQEGEDDLFGIQNSRKARIGGLGRAARPEDHGPQGGRGEAAAGLHRRERGQGSRGGGEGVRHDRGRPEKAGRLHQGEYAPRGRGGVQQPPVQPRPHAGAVRRREGQVAGERLPEFGESRLSSLQQQLFSDEPISNDLELLKLADGLTLLATTMGADHDLVKKVLAGKSPRERAYELVSGTKLKDVAARKKMFEGGADESDPMIAVAKMVDGPARAIRKKVETEIDEPRRQAYTALAKARFAMDGTGTYPDATFTLRLAFGTVKGYKEDGKDVPAYTTMDGLYARSKEQENKYPFELPKRWEEKKQSLDLKTPFNFVSTADIIGGNSGSPVVNAKGEVVGLIFDGNIQSLVLDFVFDQEVARAVSVDSRAMIEAMRKVYDAAWLADELQGKK